MDKIESGTIGPELTHYNISTESYKTFYYVAKEGSISKAAEKLFITQPAVSRTIRQLEEKIGTMLLFRTPKGVKLTNEGQILFGFVEQAFNYLTLGEKMISQMKTLESGSISIGVGDSICKLYLIPYLKRYNTDYPNISIHIMNQKSYQIIDMLKRGLIDVGIVNLPIEDDQLRITRVMDIHDCFVVGDKYRHLTEKPLPLKELADYPVMMIEKGSNSRQYMEDFLLQHGVKLKPDFELGNFELLAQFAMINLGVACLVREFFPVEIESGMLHVVPLEEEIPARGIGLITLKVVPLSSATKELIYLLTNKKKSTDDMVKSPILF
jgi:DNA-binding transcriptional LysR family regulator